eukprot:SAG22_NODE_403_length_11012_cov_12.141024_11_plen_430_part_00
MFLRADSDESDPRMQGALDGKVRDGPRPRLATCGNAPQPGMHAAPSEWRRQRLENGEVEYNFTVKSGATSMAKSRQQGSASLPAALVDALRTCHEGGPAPGLQRLLRDGCGTISMPAEEEHTLYFDQNSRSTTFAIVARCPTPGALVTKLVAGGGDIDRVDGAGWSCLMWSSLLGLKQHCRALLAAGANVTLQQTAPVVMATLLDFPNEGFFTASSSTAGPLLQHLRSHPELAARVGAVAAALQGGADIPWAPSSRWLLLPEAGGAGNGAPGRSLADQAERQRPDDAGEHHDTWLELLRHGVPMSTGVRHEEACTAATYDHTFYFTAGATAVDIAGKASHPLPLYCRPTALYLRWRVSDEVRLQGALRRLLLAAACDPAGRLGADSPGQHLWIELQRVLGHGDLAGAACARAAAEPFVWRQLADSRAGG